MPPGEGRPKWGSSWWFPVTSMGTGATLAKHRERESETGGIHRSACQAERGKAENISGSWFDSESVLTMQRGWRRENLSREFWAQFFKAVPVMIFNQETILASSY